MASTMLRKKALQQQQQQQQLLAVGKQGTMRASPQEMAAWGSFHHTMKRTKALAEASGRDISAWSEFAKEQELSPFLLADHGADPSLSSTAIPTSNIAYDPTAASSPSSPFGGGSSSDGSSGPEQLAAWSDFSNTNRAQPSLDTDNGYSPSLHDPSSAAGVTGLRSSALLKHVAEKGGMTLRQPKPKTMRLASSSSAASTTSSATSAAASLFPTLDQTPTSSSSLSPSLQLPRASFASSPGSPSITVVVEEPVESVRSTSAAAAVAVPSPSLSSSFHNSDSQAPLKESSATSMSPLTVPASSSSKSAGADSTDFESLAMQAKTSGQAALTFDGDASMAIASLPHRRADSLRYWASYISGTMPEAAQWVESRRVLQFVDSCLRGYGQILFMNNPLSGLFFLAAIFVHSRYYGICSIIGSLCSTGLAYFLALNHASIRSGLFGFNGVLCAIGVALFQNPQVEGWDDWLLYIPIVLIPSLSTIVVVVIGNILVRHFGLATFTLPFHIATWTWLLGSQVYAYFPSEGVASPPALNTVTTSVSRHPLSYDTGDVLKAIGTNIAQVFFLENHVSGYVIIIGTAVCSRISAAMSVYGSLLSIGMAMALGAPPGALYAGLWGYNPVIVAVAIGGMFYVLSARVFALATCGAIASVLAHGAVSSALKPFGLPALTFPSAITSLGFCLLSGAIPGAIPVELSKMTVPEDHLRRQKLSDRVLSKFAAVRKLARQFLLGASSVDQQFLEQLFVPILLCQAAAKGLVGEVEEYLDLGADPNLGDFQSGRTPLHIAASEGHLECVRFLLSRGSLVNQVDLHGNTPLDDAIASDHPATVALALSYFGGVHNTPAGTQARILNELAAQGQADKIARRLQLGYDVNACDLYDNRSGFHIACSEGNAAIAMIFASCGASLDLKDRFGHTPLDDAKLFGHVKLHQWLVTEGPSMSSKATGLVIASTSSAAPEMRQKSSKSGDAAMAPPMPPPTLFVAKKKKSVVNLLSTTTLNVSATLPDAGEPSSEVIELGILPGDESDREEDAEVFEAVSSREFFTASPAKLSFLSDIAKTLVGATVDDFAARVLLPPLLSATAVFGNIDALSAILEAGTNPSLTDYDSNSALHFAAGNGNTAAVRLLLSFGADVNAVNRWKHTPLDRAVLCHCSLTNVSALSAVLAQQRRVTPAGAQGGNSTGAETIRYLVSHGAVLGLSSRPMALAAELCDLIIVAGASMKLEPRRASDIMESALYELSLWIIAGADVSAAEYDGRTPLHVAAAEGLVPIVEALLLAGANVFAKDRWSQTPRDEAKTNKHQAVADRLALEESRQQRM